MLGGPGGMVPRFFFYKNGAIWCNLGVLKYVITKLNINNFKVNYQQQENLIAIFFSQINLDVHAIQKKNRHSPQIPKTPGAIY